ncbi:MAG TPA: YihY/virulence factor BrkB family protein [Bryobacteraceae bacterium]|nr:YihY/virulence factor BrkB family protein [Bryobacteraceae bacterium]
MPGRAQPPSLSRRMVAAVGEVFDHWSRDNAPRLAASLAYYTILSSAPLLVISIVVADRFFGQKAVEGQLAWEIQTLVGGQAAEAIQALLSNAHRPSTGLIATVLSLATLVAGASSVVVELHSALNLIWGVPDPDATSWFGGVLAFLRQRFYSSLMIMGAACLLLVSLVASVLVGTIAEFFRPLLPTPEWVLHTAAFLLSFLVVMLLFAAIYKLLPDVRLHWSDVLIGAAVTALLFALGKQLLAVYLSHVGFQSTYGAAWTLVIFLVWVYYSAQLFFLGAEFTKVYTRRYGSHSGGFSSQVSDNGEKRNENRK